MLRFVIPSIISSLGVAAVFFLASPDQRVITSGRADVSLVVGLLVTVIFFFPLYAFADLLRMWRHWPAWSICIVAAAFCVAFMALIPLIDSGIEDRPPISALQTTGYVLLGAAGIFALSLFFGVSYTATYYVTRHRNERSA